MKYINKDMLQSKRARTLFLTLGFVLVFLSGCVYLDSFSVTQTIDGKQCDYAYANTEATFTLTGHIECHEDHSGVQFVVGFLAPKSWKVAENAKVTYKCDLSEDHDQVLTMSAIPTTSLPKNGGGRTWVECLTQTYGVGPNVLDDMEWVVFQTDDKYNIINNQFPTYTIWITTSVGEKNVKCHLGAFVNHTDDGFSGGTDHKKYTFSSECFEVVGGKGAVVDYCNLHFNKVAPMAALQDDFVTFSFNGSVADNTLKSGDVFINGVAHCASGNDYPMTDCTPATQLKRANQYVETFTLTAWPVALFGVPEGELIETIDYWFTNADGSITITKSDDDFNNEGTPVPAQKVPFTFVLECE